MRYAFVDYQESQVNKQFTVTIAAYPESYGEFKILMNLKDKCSRDSDSKEVEDERT